MSIIDTHTHLCADAFDADRAEVLARAQAAGVTGIISVSESLADARKNLELAKRYQIIQPAAGLYPTCLDRDSAAEMMTLILSHRDRWAGIGEVGLDYWKVKEEADREIQREIFQQFIDLSNALDIPVNVHSRSAGKYAISLLLERGAHRVHMHAFDGKPSAALPGIEAGFMFSIPPSIVRSRQKQKLVKRLPLKNLMIETDSPVLGPEPDTRNEPCNASRVVDVIAEIKGIHPEEVRRALYQNTITLYCKFGSAD